MEYPVAGTGKGRTMDDTVRWRLRVIHLSEELGSVTEACCRMGMNRSSFYEWKRRYRKHGIEGLRDLPPVHRSHPQKTPHAVVEEIVSESLRRPHWGCARLSEWLRLRGTYVSPPTVQNILTKNGLGFKRERLLRLQEKHLREGYPLSPLQTAQLEKTNPCFRERFLESSSPGELLAHDVFYCARLKGTGRVYLQAVVDTFCSYAFGLLHVDTPSACAAATLHNEVLRFYSERGMQVSPVLVDGGRWYRWGGSRGFEGYLAMAAPPGVRHSTGGPRENGFLQRFKSTALEEFFRNAMREDRAGSLREIKDDFDAWLCHYNTERPHTGYRNLGNTPLGAIEGYLSRKQA
jgi:transposase InsO family protein